MRLLNRGKRRLFPARGCFGADPGSSSDEGWGWLVFGYLCWDFSAINDFLYVVNDDTPSAVVWGVPGFAGAPLVDS